MSKNNNKDIVNDNYDEYDETYTTEDDYTYDGEHQEQGEGIKEKPTADILFDTKSHLKSLDKQFRGYIERDDRWEKTSQELARDSFIDKMIGGLRSIINPINLYTYKSEEEVEKILWEKNEEFIKAALNEPTVNKEDLRTMVNIYDHALETFMGQIAKGHGSLVIRDIFAGMSQGQPIERKEKKFLDNVGNFFSFGDTNK